MDKFTLQSDEIESILKNHLKIESKVMSIETLLGNVRMRKKIVYDPYYQRNYVWDTDKATYFIESILLGTEIPPLVFFKTEQGTIEVIDGRQRYETLSKFLNGNLALTKKGLTSLKSLHKQKYSDMNEKIQDLYLDTKIRIIEFSIVNEPKLTDRQEDLIKKEIFRRYNSGITPLTPIDIDRAMYNCDSITNYFKEKLINDQNLKTKIVKLFFNHNSNREISVDKIMQKIRQFLVLANIPVKYYSRSSNRQFVIEKFYEIFMQEPKESEVIFNNFINKISILDKVYDELINNGVECNRLIFECLIWGLYICDLEKIDLSQNNINDEFYKDIAKYIKNGINKYSIVESHFYKNYEPRYEYTLKFFEDKYKKELYTTYITSSVSINNEINVNDDGNREVSNKLNELKELRIDKAEPSSTTIEDLASQMLRKKFLIRPSYQREEVINIGKSSSIIESILLDIKLPPIFIYKRRDGVSEVIDGQQRLLTILGYMGEGFCDEHGRKLFSRKNEFKLKELKVLKELKGKTFKELDEKLQDKIYDFNLSVVTIDEERNPKFNPIDLFIRLNNKPYPVRENTFEMWNSYIDKEIITKIRFNMNRNEEWMYFRKNNSRMINEEMYTILSYLSYKRNYENIDENCIFDIYQKGSRINFRIQNKKDITKILEECSRFDENKKNFLVSIKSVEAFIKKLRLILLNENVEKEKLNEYLKKELNIIFNVKANSTRRSLQDFYALWYIIQNLNMEMIRKNREHIKEDLQVIFNFMKDIPENSLNDFYDRVKAFNEKYCPQIRKLKLSENQIEELLKKQKYICPICKNSLFLGDITHNDHIIALAVGGEDTIENIQITHESCNREKWCK